MTTGSQFECRLVSKTYDGQAVLVEVSFTLCAGVHTTILGPSGCGKSTLLRLLAGLDFPSQGQVLLDGRAASEPKRIVVPPHQRGVAMVFQDLALWPNLSVIGNVMLGLAGAGLPKREAALRARDALALCGIDALAQRKPGQISGGQQQRVALARALAVRPRFLFLDEPFTGLDLVIKTQLTRDIAALRDRQRLTIVLVTHDPLEAASLCHAAIMLDQGRVVEAGALTDLLKAPRSEMLKIFRDQNRGIASLPGSPPGAQK